MKSVFRLITHVGLLVDTINSGRRSDGRAGRRLSLRFERHVERRKGNQEDEDGEWEGGRKADREVGSKGFLGREGKERENECDRPCEEQRGGQIRSFQERG